MNRQHRVGSRRERHTRQMFRDRIYPAADRYMGPLSRILTLVRYQRQNNLFELRHVGSAQIASFNLSVNRATLARRVRDLLFHLSEHLHNVHRQMPDEHGAWRS